MRFSFLTGYVALLFGVCGMLAGQSEESQPMVSVSFYAYLWPAYSGFGKQSHARFEEYDSSVEEGGSVLLKANNYKLPLQYGSGLGEMGEMIRPEKLELRLGRLSGVQQYRGPPTLYFSLDGESEGEGRGTPIHIGSVQIDQAVEKLLLLFTRVGENSYHILSIPYPEDNGDGQMNFAYNLTRDSVVCTMGESQYQLEPAQSVVLDSKIVDTYFEMILVAAKGAGGQWQRKLSRKYPRVDGKDTLFLIYNRNGDADLFDLMRVQIPR